MFVIPPSPPRYSIPVAYATGTSNGMPVPISETNNIIRPLDGGCSLQVGEATPPPHPSEAPITNPNPLTTIPAPPTSGVKLTLIVTGSRHDANLLDLKVIKENDREGRWSDSGGESAHQSNSSAPAFGGGNPALASSGTKELPKRRKPKTNIVKSSSSFVSRVIVHESTIKRLNERTPDGILAFANINRAFQWLDLSAKNKEEPLCKVLFTKAHILCHDVNEATVLPSHIDVVMGSSAGDILWYEPISQKYARINKNGGVNNSPVTHIKWVPGSENLFLAAHANGQLIAYDKEKDDAPFAPETDRISNEEANSNADERRSLRVLKSVNSRNQKTNPIAVWRLSNQRINQFAFSPDHRHLAIVLEDGTMRIMNYLSEKMTDVFPSYYGGMICVCWSPDGKYIVTGGQDDLVSIWSVPERKIIARCQGHNSWVSTVAFDPWRCDERNYRFGSVGDDCRLLLWDFNVGMLPRPKALQASVRQRNSIIAGMHHMGRRRTDSMDNQIHSNSNRTEHFQDFPEDTIHHPVEPRAMTALLPPIMSKVVGEDPICWLGFQEDCIITSSLEGHIRTWDRPREVVKETRADATGSGTSGFGDS